MKRWLGCRLAGRIREGTRVVRPLDRCRLLRGCKSARVREDKGTVRDCHNPSRRGSRAWRRPVAAAWVPAFVTLAFVFVTLLTATIARSVTRSRDAVRFDHLVEQTRSSILNRFDTHVALLYGVAGLFASDGADVT